MSSWNSEPDNGLGWDGEPGWTFNALDGDWYGGAPFAGIDHMSASNSPDRAQPSFTPTNNLAAPPSHHRTNGTPRAPDTSFLDDLLHATDPHRNRSPQSELPRRHPVDNPRESSRSTLLASNNPQGHADRRSNISQQRSFAYTPNGLFDFSDDDNPTPASTQPSTRPSRRDSEEFVTLEDDTDPEEEIAVMPPELRRRRHPSRTSSVVDLTTGESASGPSRQRPRGRKRSADLSTAAEGRSTKRGKVKQEDIEEVDLSQDAPSAEEELLKKQQQEAIKQQQAAEESQGPSRIGKRTCIICMENFTNCTIASCGHFYCHECLIQALLAGEKNSDRGTGTCPQCRKPLQRNSKKKKDIIPLSFMKKETFQRNQRRRLQAS